LYYKGVLLQAYWGKFKNITVFLITVSILSRVIAAPES